jgi:hypothetical protein
MKAWLWKLLHRIAFVIAGVATLAVGLAINVNAGTEILAGLLSPDSIWAIVISVARLMVPALGLWFIYRGVI